MNVPQLVHQSVNPCGNSGPGRLVSPCSDHALVIIRADLSPHKRKVGGATSRRIDSIAKLQVRATERMDIYGVMVTVDRRCAEWFVVTMYMRLHDGLRAHLLKSRRRFS